MKWTIDYDDDVECSELDTWSEWLSKKQPKFTSAENFDRSWILSQTPKLVNSVNYGVIGAGSRSRISQ